MAAKTSSWSQWLFLAASILVVYGAAVAAADTRVEVCVHGFFHLAYISYFALFGGNALLRF